MTNHEFVISLRSLFQTKFISAFGNKIKSNKSSFPCSSKNYYRPQNIGIGIKLQLLFILRDDYFWYLLHNILHYQFTIWSN